MIPRACVICGATSVPGTSRCIRHPKAKLSRHRQYRKLREQLLAAHPSCHLCGGSFTDPADPPVLDHVIPRAHGGTDHPSNLKPAHRSCNGRKGAKIGSWVETTPPATNRRPTDEQTPTRPVFFWADHRGGANRS
jgi:5-methylcytosine-specific restriction endonuclease McrA